MSELLYSFFSLKWIRHSHGGSSTVPSRNSLYRSRVLKRKLLFSHLIRKLQSLESHTMESLVNDKTGWTSWLHLPSPTYWFLRWVFLFPVRRKKTTVLRRSYSLPYVTVPKTEVSFSISLPERRLYDWKTKRRTPKIEWSGSYDYLDRIKTLPIFISFTSSIVWFGICLNVVTFSTSYVPKVSVPSSYHVI